MKIKIKEQRKNNEKVKLKYHAWNSNSMITDF